MLAQVFNLPDTLCQELRSLVHACAVHLRRELNKMLPEDRAKHEGDLPPSAKGALKALFSF